MDFERTIKTQRLRLLRLVAGLVVLLEFLSVGPVSRSFSRSVCGFVGSILSRAESAAQYLVIVQARLMAARSGLAVDRDWFSEPLACALAGGESDVSLSGCCRRLGALHAMLSDLPRHALRLIRRIEKQMDAEGRSGRVLPRPDQRPIASFLAWRLTASRVERPPDKSLYLSAIT